MEKQPSSFPGITDVFPGQINPYIFYNIGYSHKQQPHCGIFCSGFDTTPVFKAIARLNAEAFPTVFMNRSQIQRNFVNSVCKIPYPVPAVLSSAVNTYNPYFKGDRTVFPTLHRIDGFIATTSPEQSAGPPFFPRMTTGVSNGMPRAFNCRMTGTLKNPLSM